MASCELIWPIHWMANYLFQCYLTSQFKLPYLTLLLWKEDIRLRTMTPPSPELNCFLHCVMVVSLFSPLFRLWFTSLWWLVLSYLAQKMAYPKTIHFLCIFKGRWSKKYSSFVQNWTFLNCLTGFANKIPFYWSTIQKSSGNAHYQKMLRN